MQQQQPSKQLSDEPPVKKLAKERLDYKNIHANHASANELLNKENQSNSREVLLDNSTTLVDNTTASSSGIVSTTSSGSLVKTVFNSEQNDAFKT